MLENIHITLRWLKSNDDVQSYVMTFEEKSGHLLKEGDLHMTLNITLKPKSYNNIHPHIFVII